MSRALPPEIQNVLLDWPQTAQARFQELRKIVIETAAAHAAVGPLTETLKWGEPSFLTQIGRSGSTLRIAWKAKHPTEIGLFVICHTDLIEQVRTHYPTAFRYDGSRAAYQCLTQPIPSDAVSYLAMRAQTFHLKEH